MNVSSRGKSLKGADELSTISARPQLCLTVLQSLYGLLKEIFN